MSVAAVSEPRDSPFGRIASRAMSSGGLLSVSQDFTAKRPSAYKVAGSSKNAVRRAQTENVFCIQNICISQIATAAGQYLRGIGSTQYRLEATTAMFFVKDNVQSISLSQK